MNGFNISEAGHAAVILPPQSINGGVTAQAFSMHNYKHASILIASGAEATQDASTITLALCSNEDDANPINIPFNYYFQALGGAGNDVLGSIQNATSSGITLASGDWPPNGLIVIEIDADELEATMASNSLSGSLGVDACLALSIACGAYVDYACAIVVLSGARYANVGSPSVTVASGYGAS